jgi:hypothetical protein
MSQVRQTEDCGNFTRQRVRQYAYTLTNGPTSFRLIEDAFLHSQHGLSPFQQLLLLYGLSVCVLVL